ncbi:MAG: Cytosol aminopeptidase [Sodalis sp.]|nr:MAG: Cytosol aminopeptidase [Sodalis sp.]
MLCGDLTCIEHFNSDVVIDVATLTGTCVVALGHHYLTVLMSNHNPLAHELIGTAKQIATTPGVCRWG